MADPLPLPPKRRRPRVVNTYSRVTRVKKTPASKRPKTKNLRPNARAFERASEMASFKRGAVKPPAKRDLKSASAGPMQSLHVTAKPLPKVQGFGDDMRFGGPDLKAKAGGPMQRVSLKAKAGGPMQRVSLKAKAGGPMQSLHVTAKPLPKPPAKRVLKTASSYASMSKPRRRMGG